MVTVHNFRTKYWVSSIQLEDSTAKRWDVGCFTYLDGVLAIFSCTLWYSCKLHRRPSFVVSRLMLEMWFTSCSPVKKEIVILISYWLHAGCHYRFKVTKQQEILQSSGRFIDFGILRNALRRKFYVFQDFHVLGTQETGLPKSLLLFNTDCIVVIDPVLTFPEIVVVYLTLAFHPF